MWLKELQNCKRSKLEVQKKKWKYVPAHPSSIVKSKGGIKMLAFFRTSNFDLLQFCIPLNLTYEQYLIWKYLQILNGLVSIQELGPLLRSVMSSQCLPSFVVLI